MPLGILFHNEAKITEMCQILDSLDQYVPAKKATRRLWDEVEDEFFEVDDTKVHTSGVWNLKSFCTVSI